VEPALISFPEQTSLLHNLVSRLAAYIGSILTIM